MILACCDAALCTNCSYLFVVISGTMDAACALSRRCLREARLVLSFYHLIRLWLHKLLQKTPQEVSLHSNKENISHFYTVQFYTLYFDTFTPLHFYNFTLLHFTLYTITLLHTFILLHFYILYLCNFHIR